MKRCITLIFVVFLTVNVSRIAPIYADSCDSSCGSLEECQIKIGKCQEAWSQMEAAKKPHVDALKKMESDIAAFQARIKTIEAELVKKAAAIKEGEKELSGLLEVAGKRIRSFYIRTVHDNPIMSLLSSSDVGVALRSYGYEQAVVNEDKKVIIQTAMMVKSLEERKIKLEGERVALSKLKTDLDTRAGSVRKLVNDANAYQTKLTSMIATLSTQQQSFLAQKLADLGISRSAYNMKGGCSDDRSIDPGFSPRFAFFTFGVPNRIGLNQFGAKGRAEAGQSAQTILSAYFDANYTTGYNQSVNIHVVGTNEYGQSFDENWSIEEYLKHLYEMPSGWDGKALQAQAVAARSYALAYTNNGASSICPSQQCQVVKKELNAQSWIDAVNATAGHVLTKDGNPIKAWYSSTHGGYIFNSGDIGWSGTSWTKRATDLMGGVNSISDLFSTAYDRSSPTFYCDWGSRSQYNKTAWLKPEEVADVVNVILLAKQDSSTQKHLAQVDKPNPDGVDTWDASTVRSKLGGSAYASISSVSMSFDLGSGRTTQVTVTGDGKSNSFGGDEFKSFFNLRAPANIQIVGPLYNIEKK